MGGLDKTTFWPVLYWTKMSGNNSVVGLFNFPTNNDTGLVIWQWITISCLFVSEAISILSVAVLAAFYARKYSKSSKTLTLLKGIFILWLLNVIFALTAPLVFTLALLPHIHSTFSVNSMGPAFYISYANVLLILLSGILIYSQKRKYERWKSYNCQLANYF